MIIICILSYLMAIAGAFLTLAIMHETIRYKYILSSVFIITIFNAIILFISLYFLIKT